MNLLTLNFIHVCALPFNMTNRFQKEFTLYNSGAKYVIGVDEVGRGPLAGPVVAVAVVFGLDSASADEKSWWHQIADSKKLSETKRKNLNQEIMNNSLYSVGVSSVEEIEQLNILQASLLAMRRAVEGLNLELSGASDHSIILVDGKNTIPNLKSRQEAIVKGDSGVHSIAAASIIAKVYRDKLMTDLANQFPNYGLEMHKGYGTKFHIDAIKQLGLSPIHRASFCGNIV